MFESVLFFRLFRAPAIGRFFDKISHFQSLHPDSIREEENEDDGMFMTANGWVSIEDHVCALFDKAAV